MKMIEVKAAVKRERRWINLDQITKVTLKQNESILLEPMMIMVRKGEKGHQELIEALKISTHSPASETSELEKE